MDFWLVLAALTQLRHAQRARDDLWFRYLLQPRALKSGPHLQVWLLL